MPDLRATPTQRRQIGDHSPWIFWRDHPTRPGRQGFVCIVHACVAPGCPCTEVSLSGMLVDDRLQQAVVKPTRQIELAFTPADIEAATDDDPPMTGSGTVWLDLAKRTVRSEGGPAQVLDQLLPWLTAELDDELTAALRREVEQQRAQNPAGDPWVNYAPGDLVYHGDFFPAAGLPQFGWRSRTWEVEDLHCVEPKCPCRDVRLTFLRMDLPSTDGADCFAGTLVVTLPSLSPRDLEVQNGHLASRDELRELWHAFRTAHPDLGERLAARRAQMKTLRRPGEPAQSDKKVGRNDPCPCGSGKKWKKCCGA